MGKGLLICASLAAGGLGTYLYIKHSKAQRTHLPDKQKILNWTETKRTLDGGYRDGFWYDEFATLFGTSIYFEYGETPLNPEKIISFFDSKQSDDGSWCAWNYHWGPITAQTLMVYKFLNALPAKSLATFFEKIDTWEKVVIFTQAYNEGNFWGGIWGSVVAWYYYYNEDPPWWNDYDNAVNEYRESWESDTHQSSHVIYAYYQLGKTLPEFTVDSILASQEPEGSWGADIMETHFGLSVLRFYYENAEHLTSIVEAAKKAKPYILKCYQENNNYGWFTSTPYTEDQILHRTWCGVAALNTFKFFGI